MTRLSNATPEWRKLEEYMQDNPKRIETKKERKENIQSIVKTT